MARKSRSLDASDAFELFLDTISNAFGGIVFISLLVCILLQLSGTAATVQQVDKTVVAQIGKKLRDLSEEVARLLALHGTLDARIAAAKARGGDDAVRVKFADLKVQEEKGEKVATGLTTEVNQLKDKIAILKTKVPKEPRPAQAAPATEVRVVQGHETLKKQVGILLSGRRMSFVCQYDAQGNPVADNDAEVSVKELKEGDAVIRLFQQKPGAGFLIADTPALEQELRKRLAPFTARPGGGKTERDCHHLMIAVWPDSYRECERLRDAVIRMNFEYGLLLMETGEPVRTGAEIPLVN